MRPRTLRRVLVVLLLASVPLAARAQDTTSDNVLELSARWTEAYNTHDRAGLAALYAEDARLMMHGAPTYVGREKIAAFWAKDMLERNPLTILTVTDAVNGVDMVLVHGNYQVIQRDNGDVLGAGRFAHIWTRTADDKWLIDRDLWLEPDAR
jgi:uncharacterized protein (TIGR02246 family)